MLPIPISLDKAKTNKLFYFVATGIVYRDTDARCLILKRSVKEVAHPGRWGVIGGKMEWSDLQSKPPTRMNGNVLDWEGEIENLIKREAMEEAHVMVNDFRYITSIAFLRPDGVPAVCTKFACRYVGGDVRVSSDFEDFSWVNESEIRAYPCIDGIPHEVAAAINLYVVKK